MKKLFVGRLPYSFGDDELRQLFEQHGAVTSAKVIFDRYTNRSRGFGFVEMEDAAADEAMEKLNNTQVDTQTIVVKPANDREEGGNRESERHQGAHGA